MWLKMGFNMDCSFFLVEKPGHDRTDRDFRILAIS